MKYLKSLTNCSNQMRTMLTAAYRSYLSCFQAKDLIASQLRGHAKLKPMCHSPSLDQLKFRTLPNYFAIWIKDMDFWIIHRVCRNAKGDCFGGKILYCLSNQ